MSTRVLCRAGVDGRRGFTLIELLVVIAIISLLVSILLPALSKAKDLARQGVCMGHLKGAVSAVHFYAADNQGDIVPVVWSRVDKNDPASWPGPTDYPDWADAYFSDQLLLGQYTANEELYGWCQPDSSWRCPSDVAFRDERSRDHVSYGLCTRSYPWISKSKGWSRMWKIDRVRSSTKMLAFLDSTISRFHPGHGKDPPFFGNIEPMVKGRQDAWAFGVPESNYNHSLRHVNQTTNCSFLDGHVSNLTDLYHAFRTGKLVIDHKAQ